MKIVFLGFILLSVSLPTFAETVSLDCDNDYFKSEKPTYAETEEERIKRLDKELEAALSQFDECLDDSEKSQNSSSSSSSSSSASTTISGDLPSIKQSKNQTKPYSQEGNINGVKASSSKNQDSGNINGTQKHQMNNGSIPKDIPLKTNDDIVAVQLREMAINEQDPELKEKYWDKYREYKGIKKEEKK